MESKYYKTDEMIADFMTKGLNSERFEMLKLMAGMASIIKHPENKGRSVEKKHLSECSRL